MDDERFARSGGFARHAGDHSRFAAARQSRGLPLVTSRTGADSDIGCQTIAAGRFEKSCSERKVRTPTGSMPRRMRGRARRKPRPTESVTENKPPAATARSSRVRVKRRGKSPPPGAQVPGHEKPHAVQDKTGSGPPSPRRFRSAQLPGNSRTPRERGSWLPATESQVREMIVESAGDCGGTEFGLSAATKEGASGNGGAFTFSLSSRE